MLFLLSYSYNVHRELSRLWFNMQSEEQEGAWSRWCIVSGTQHKTINITISQCTRAYLLVTLVYCCWISSIRSFLCDQDVNGCGWSIFSCQGGKNKMARPDGGASACVRPEVEVNRGHVWVTAETMTASHWPRPRHNDFPSGQIPHLLL